MNTDLSRLDPSQHGWLSTPPLRLIFEAIRQAGGEARVVGGAVRDALMARSVGEIDLATTLTPDCVTAALARRDIKVKPTGIDHGTVTIVIDHQGYEMTTLRHDVDTDGRRATVAFTQDWQADAARRDFTMNAIYADADGNLYDYFGGREDMAQKRLRFIGDAEQRIREDVLRILRFFRFTAWFGGGPDGGSVDAAGLAACAKLAHLIPTLSVERVWREISKLLAAPDPLSCWQLMIEKNVLAGIMPDADNLQRLQSLLNAEKKYGFEPLPLARLVALRPQDGKSAAQVAVKLKLSKREAERLGVLTVLPHQLAGKLDPVPLRRAIYANAAEPTRQAVLLVAADHPATDIETALATIDAWDDPVFPVQGADFITFGMKPGPAMGAMLRDIEAWWIDDDFRPNRAACLAEAQRRIAGAAST